MSPPPPWRAAVMISRASFVKSAPRFASLAPFCRLIWDHLLWPDIGPPATRVRGPSCSAERRNSTKRSCKSLPQRREHRTVQAPASAAEDDEHRREAEQGDVRDHRV